MADNKRVSSRQIALQVPGFRLGAVSAGLKKAGLLDLCVIASERPCAAAGVFTRNRVTGEPVKVCRRHLRNDTHHAIVANSKIANVCRGRDGILDAEAMADRVAEHLGCRRQEVFVASTGVIGAPLPMHKILPGIDAAVTQLRPEGWSDAARAIMTTDTRPKLSRRRVEIGRRTVTIAGMAKGSGMIHPDMATMLAFILTDAHFDKPLLQDILARVADQTFNCLSVDGDTSTSDSVLLLANGASGHRIVKRAGSNSRIFERALTEVCTDLARQIARDGEGAQHLITIKVQGARGADQARHIGQTIATSPLVKTAIFGRDPNWGRIAAAAGRAGVPFSEDKLTIFLNGTLLFDNGQPVNYEEDALTRTLDQEEVEIVVRIGGGPGEATIWTCDLSDEYVRINARYRT